MTENLFIASTPLQLLNATEARDRFHPGQGNKLAVIRTPLRRGSPTNAYRQVLRGLVDDGWSDVWFPELSKIGQLGFSQVSRRFIGANSRVSSVYTGSFQSPQNHLINSIKHDQLTLLDDGCGIHTLLERYPHKNRQKRWSDLLLRRCGSWPNDPDLRLFTCFNVNWPAAQTVRNDYRILRNKLKSSIAVRPDELVFISQPIESALGVKVDYQAVVEQMKAETGAKTVRWIKHPREPDSENFGEDLGYPIELFGLREKYVPGAFATFCSSAIRTLGLLYDTAAYCIEISDQMITKKTGLCEMSKIYEDYRKSGVQLMPYRGLA